MKKQNKKAFTLSEILITLSIMGLVMALTIPSLMRTTNKDAYVGGLRKMYGLLDSATNTIMMRNSGTLINAFGDATTTASVRSYTARNEYFNNLLDSSRLCTYNGYNGNCFPVPAYKLSGGTLVEGFSLNLNTFAGATLADGSTVQINITNALCDGAGLSLNLPYSAATPGGINNLCGKIYVDVNGELNPPNTFGRDLFVFYLGKNGLYPGGDPHTDINDWNINCNPSDNTHNGYGCAAKVLQEGKIDY